MGGTESKLSGPDLSEGTAIDAVPDGGTLLGHAHGEPVILVRRQKSVFAVGATCTHYGGPLAEGLVVGEEIRCPWHHACFSLRTGQPVRAPALNPVPCFDVEARDGEVYVLGKSDPGTRRPASVGPSSVIVVGAGAAGNACVESLREHGYAGPIALIGAEGTVPVDRPNLSKDFLAGNAPPEWIPLRGEDFYRELQVELLVGRRVTAIDVARKSITLEGGESRGYGALVLATGAEPVQLPVPGADGPHVFVLRTLGDAEAIIARSAGAKKAVVIGAGFIGLEVAASLRTRGLEVHIVAPEAIPLARVMGDAIGRFVMKLHEDHGVHFHLGTTVMAIEPAGVLLAGGPRIPADLVVVGVGVRPDVTLAKQAGLVVEGGVVVDERLRASALVSGRDEVARPGGRDEVARPGGRDEIDIWAIGDLARWPDPRSGEKIRVEHWVVAERMGQIAARNILGENVRCDLVPFFWSAHYDVTINYVGHASGWDRVDLIGDLEGRGAAVAFRRAGKTLAVATIGRDLVSLQAEAALERGDEPALQRLVPPSRG